MNYLKKLGKGLLISISTIFILTFIFTLFNYFNIINTSVLNVFKIIIPLFSLALGGFFIGKNTSKNGWLEGIKLGIIIVLFILIGNLIIMKNLNMKDFVFYALLIICSILGSMFGINKKKEEN